MLKIYTKSGCNSSKKALEWIQEFKLPYTQQLLSHINDEDFYNILSLTENGVEDLIISRGKNNKYNHRFIEQMTLSEISSLIKEFPEIFKTPLIFDKNKLLIGWHSEDVRQFLSRSYREEQRRIS